MIRKALLVAGFIFSLYDDCLLTSLAIYVGFPCVSSRLKSPRNCLDRRVQVAAYNRAYKDVFEDGGKTSHVRSYFMQQ